MKVILLSWVDLQRSKLPCLYSVEGLLSNSVADMTKAARLRHHKKCFASDGLFLHIVPTSGNIIRKVSQEVSLHFSARP